MCFGGMVISLRFYTYTITYEPLEDNAYGDRRKSAMSACQTEKRYDPDAWYTVATTDYELGEATAGTRLRCYHRTSRLSCLRGLPSTRPFDPGNESACRLFDLSIGHL